MRRRLQLVLLVYLALLAVGVFGPAPRDEVGEAARRVRDVEAEIRDRVGGSSSTTAGAATPTSVAPTTPTATVEPPAMSSGSPRPERDPSWWDDIRAEEVFNAAVFVPIGFLLPLCWPRLRWLTLLLGAQLSGVIELVQDVLLDWRSPRINDVRWNTLGTAIGFALWLGLLLAAPWLVRRLSDDRTPAAGTRTP
jgi:hypothetical protein